MHITTTSESGLHFGAVEAKSTDIVTLTLSCDLYATNTPAAVVTAILFAELLTSGAGNLSRDDFNDALSQLGASIETSVARGVLTISLTTTAPVLTRSLRLFSLMLNKPTFAQGEYRRAVRTLGNELHVYEENARALAHDALTRALFATEDRRFVHAPQSLTAALSHVSRSHVRQLYKTFLTKPWTATAAGSATSVAHIKRTLRQVRQNHPERVAAIDISKLSANPERLMLTPVTSKQNIEVSIGGTLPLRKSDADFPAFLFGLAVLGKWGGFSGRLMSTVREKEGLTYSIYATIEGTSAREPGYWRIMTFFAPTDIERGLTSTFREIRLIHEKGISDNEWQRFLTILRTNSTLVFDSLTKTGLLVHQQLTSGSSWPEYEAFRQKLLSVTKDEVDAALRKYLHPEALTISLAGPLAGKERSLRSLTATL